MFTKKEKRKEYETKQNNINKEAFRLATAQPCEDDRTHSIKLKTLKKALRKQQCLLKRRENLTINLGYLVFFIIIIF